jgi:hypothetical protein
VYLFGQEGTDSNLSRYVLFAGDRRPPASVRVPVVGEIGNDVFGQLFANVSRPTVRVAGLGRACACCTASCSDTSLAQCLALEDTRSRSIAQWNYMPDNDAAHLLDAGDEPARILELISPTGFEEFFREPLARAA